MSRREFDQGDEAPLPFTTPTKACRNDGACHAGSDAEGTEVESEPDVEKQSDESTGKKLEYHPFRQYNEIKLWKTGSDSVLKPAQIDHEIYALMKKFMQQSRLMKAPGLGHKQLDTYVGLWKLQRAKNYNSRTDEWTRVYQCPMSDRCKCNALVRIFASKDYKLLQFN